MFAKCPARRPATADEVANVAELLMSPKGAFITGSDFNRWRRYSILFLWGIKIRKIEYKLLNKLKNISIS